MFKYTKSDVIKIARENEFIVNNTEKEESVDTETKEEPIVVENQQINN